MEGSIILPPTLPYLFPKWLYHFAALLAVSGSSSCITSSPLLSLSSLLNQLIFLIERILTFILKEFQIYKKVANLVQRISHILHPEFQKFTFNYNFQNHEMNISTILLPNL